ncbi:MAG: hypothetical protein FWB95_05900 [Treponema sp.]|nr:hypothetical protein [Treponema sp.]
MKKVFIIILLFLCFCFYRIPFLQAQELADVKIHVQAMEGGASPEMRNFFYGNVLKAVTDQYYEVVSTLKKSDFALRGTLGPYIVKPGLMKRKSPVPKTPVPPIQNSKDKRDFFSWHDSDDLKFFDSTGNDNYTDTEINLSMPEYNGEEIIFLLEIYNSRTKQVIGEQNIVFSELNNDVVELISTVVRNLLSIIPSTYQTNDFRDKFLFFDACFLWVPRIYTAETQSTSWLNFGLRFSFDYQFLNFMALGLSVNFVQDWVVVSDNPADEYRDIIMEIPVELKFVFKPFLYMMVEPYGGIAFNFSLTKTTKPSLLTWVAGVELGIKAGPGMITIDPRFAMDIFNSALTRYSGNVIEYSRLLINIGVGYKIGIITKPKK